MTITHDTTQNRFCTAIDGHTAYLTYIDNGDTLIYNHTAVPHELGGQGLGSKIVKHALDYARDSGKKVVPTCGFVAHFIDKNPEYQSVLA